MSDEFFAQYRDPRWQKRRLEVMSAAGFKCQRCDTTDKTLNVHHRHYERGNSVWDYRDDQLSESLCKDPKGASLQ